MNTDLTSGALFRLASLRSSLVFDFSFLRLFLLGHVIARLILSQLSPKYSRWRTRSKRSLDPSKSSIRLHSDRSVSSLRLLVLLFKEPLERIGRLSGLA